MKNLLNYVAISLLIFTGCQKEMMLNPNNGGKSGSITRFSISAGFMYVLDQNKILVYNISNSQSPVLVNQLTTDYGLETITIYDGTVYVGSRSSLYILDISNPSSPVVLSKSDRDVVLQGGCDPVAVKGNYAFSTVKIIQNRCGRTSALSQLLVYDVTSKTNPNLQFSYTMNEPNGLGYQGNYLFVCDEGVDKIVVFDITDPANPVEFSSIDLIDPVDLIATPDKMIVSSKTGFTFFDISDITNIRETGTIIKQ